MTVFLQQTLWIPEISWVSAWSQCTSSVCTRSRGKLSICDKQGMRRGWNSKCGICELDLVISSPVCCLRALALQISLKMQYMQQSEAITLLHQAHGMRCPLESCCLNTERIPQGRFYDPGSKELCFVNTLRLHTGQRYQRVWHDAAHG